MQQELLLIALILGPLASSLIILISVYSILNYFKKNKSKTYPSLKFFTLDADRGLAAQGYLWLSILAPIMYFVTFGLLSWNGYSISFTREGFDDFVKISALPLALLSLSIPLTILVARIHATHQTSVQISTTRHKNNIDSYYAHRKAMFEYFSGVKDVTYPGQINGDFHAHPRLHLRFFIDKGPANGTPEVNSEKFKESVKTLSEIQEHIHVALISGISPTENIQNYAQACTKLFALAGTLNLPCIYEDLKSKKQKFNICLNSDTHETDDLQFLAIGTNTHQLIGSYRYTRSFLRVLCEFAGHDVKFFDEKKHPAIDKGNDYMSRPYHTQDISYILQIIRDTSLQLKNERWEKTQTNII
ncbi:hypothetical protein [Pseudomonas fluorescens]|uniref:hypothetical protein n=1 Tax=Pseudomonas fluorescens TaxID=294 RepID=UPI00124033DC|nr:hypothetical protein [Pseudomonas fluorescens]VVQ02514.1 hypothetical protein PS906_05147 [Pseudomonas fluorescens]